MRTRAWSRPSGDEGFTLLELSVAMIVIAVVIVTLVGLQISSLKTVGIARQRQAATALADQKLERLRALPYSTIQAGLLSTDSTLTGDSHISAGRLTAPWNEALVTSGSQSATELNPHTQTTTLNGINYSVSVYVTHPVNTDGTDSTSAVDFWLTVIVKWTSGSTGSNGKSVVVRTRAAYPAGCKGLGSANHPYAGPCQPFLYGTAGRTAAQITVTSADPSSSPIPGIPLNSASVVFAGYSSQIGVEQTTSALAKAVNSGTNVDGTVVDESTTTAAADIDPGTATATGPFNTSVPSSSSSTSQISGSTGSLNLTRTGNAGGSAIQAAVASSSAGNCQDLAGNVMATNQACAASQFGAAGVNEADLDLAAIGGRDLPAFALASFQPASSAARSYASRLLLQANGHCTGTTGDGCAASGAQRSLASIVVGSIPAATDPGDSVPSGFNGMVTSNGLTESATAEVGQGSSATLTTVSATRTGSLTYWTGSGYQSASLTTTANYPLGAVTASYARNGSPQITIAMSGVLKVTAPTTATSTPTGCQPTACTTKANAGAIIADVTYQITSAGGQIAYFTVELNLGAVLANSTYRAVPSA